MCGRTLVGAGTTTEGKADGIQAVERGDPRGIEKPIKRHMQIPIFEYHYSSPWSSSPILPLYHSFDLTYYRRRVPPTNSNLTSTVAC